LKTEDCHQRVVSHDHLLEREVMAGIGPVAVRQPRVCDRLAGAVDPDRIRFSPSILPPYMRRSNSVETLLPIIYLKGISTGDFSKALAALFGKDAVGLSASAIGRLKDGWLDEHTAWQTRDLSAKRYVYIWVDGIHFQARLEDEKQIWMAETKAIAELAFRRVRGELRAEIPQGGRLPRPRSRCCSPSMTWGRFFLIDAAAFAVGSPRGCRRPKPVKVRMSEVFHSAVG
jgi:hypothetical protein